jgi:hypothetical protein
MKAQCIRSILREHAIQHEGMDVHVEVQRAAEPLEDCHRAPAAVHRALAPRAAAESPRMARTATATTARHSA